MEYTSLESGISKRRSWGKFVQRLIELKHVDDTKASVKSSAGDSVPTEDDPFEEALCAETMDNISQIFQDSTSGTSGPSRLLAPDALLQRIGRELRHLAAFEPCGLRGALIDLCVEDGNTYHGVGQISVDPYTVPTFHLTFLLRPDLGGLLPKFARRLSNSIRLSTGFTVVKKKLYSSDEAYIEELRPKM